MEKLPDHSGFFVAEIDTSPNRQREDPIKWNPWNKVVQDHRDGHVHEDLTNIERAKRGLPTPWNSDMFWAEDPSVAIP